MPRKAVAIVLWCGLIGAAIFTYFTFPRTKDEIPRSENQRPFPSSPGPNGIPVPLIPHPDTPKPPPGSGPNLRVMAWAGDDDAHALSREMDAFAARTGVQPVLTVSANAADYRRDLRQAIDAGTPPDVCLVDARDFSGLDPEHDLAAVARPPGYEKRSLEAFQAGGDNLRAVPDEFSVALLFYHPRDFDRAGLGWPGKHWTWDILEAMSRALASQRLTTDTGARIYPLELPADFDFWNILCTQAGHAALDHDTWHLADADGRESRMRGLGLIHEFFQELAVTAPPDAPGQPGTYFAQNRASLLIGPSELGATLPPGSYAVTLVPADLCRASLAQVNGWAVMASTPQIDAARSLARFLSARPVHAGWVSAVRPAQGVDPAADNADSLCRQALEQALLPRLEPKTTRLAQLLDEQIGLFAHGDPATAENLNARIESEYLADYAPASERNAAEPKQGVAPKAQAPSLRGL